MTTEHQDDQRRGGGFREAVNELFGRNERDGRDTSQLDELNRDEARRTGDPAYADQVGDARHEHAAAEQSQYGGVQAGDPAGQTTPGVRYDAGDPAMAGTGQAAAGAHGDALTDDVAGRHDTTGGYDDRAMGGQAVDRTPPQSQPMTQGEHLGETRTPQGGELRGDSVAPDHVRQGGDPTAQGQVQHGGELRGDPTAQGQMQHGGEVRGDHDLAGSGLPGDGRSDMAARDAGVDTGTATRDRSGVGRAGAGAGGAGHHDGGADGDDERAALVTRDRADSYSARWDSVKGEFVDEPRRAVADADALVGELLDELQELFKQQRTQIEQGLDRDETSTEDLRLALRRYRSFFDRLLSI